MKDTIFTVILCFAMTIIVSSANADDKKLKEQATADLFKTKCTSCHEAKRAEEMHASKETFTDIIKKMIGKGAKVSETEAKEISEFLAAPSRFLLKEKCVSCHTLDRIFEAHEKGFLNKDTLKRMQQKEGSGLTEKEVDSIYEALNGYYFIAPQMPVPAGP